MKLRLKESEIRQVQQRQVEYKSEWIGVLICGMVFAVYVKTTHQSLPGGDSGELIIAANELGVSHPPGYPVFTILSYLCIKLIPSGSISWRVNVMSTFLSALTSFFIYRSIRRLCHQNSSSCLLGVSLFCFMRLTWTWGITAEVFSLNNLFISLLLYLAVKFEHDKNTDKIQTSCIGSFICGLSLCNQHTILVYVVCLAVWVLYTLVSHKVLTLKILLIQVMLFTCGLLPYIYLPISSYYKSARWTWGDQTTLAGFIRHVSRQEYGTFQLLKDHTGQGLRKGLWAYYHHILEEWGYLGLFGVLLSGYAFTKRFINGKRCFCVLYIMMVIYILMFTWLANLDITNPLLLGVIERFWIQSDLILSVIVAVTFDQVISLLKEYLSVIDRMKLDFIGVLLISVLFLNKNYTACNHSNNEVILDFAKNILHSLPDRSIVLTKGDLPSNSLRYASLGENIRPDVTIFDQEILTFEWSLPMLKMHYPGIIFPGDLLYTITGTLQDGRKTFNFKTFLDANYNRRPIFACIGVQEHDSSWQGHYELWPYGVCYKVLKQGDPVDIDKYVNHTNSFLMNWSHPYDGFDITTWEHVATEEMWNAKASLALDFLQKSDLYEGPKEKLVLLQYSYDIYHNAMDTDRVFPVHWHKNLALVCEKMSHLKLKEKKRFLSETVKEFTIFLEHDQTDKDYQLILDAVINLTEEIKNL